MSYEIPTEEIENIKKSNNGIIMINHNKNVSYEYRNFKSEFDPKSMQMYVQWFFRKDDKTLGIESILGESNSRENFRLILQILKSITTLKDGRRLGGNIVASSLKKIIPQVGFTKEGNKFYLYKNKF
ncbi:MAG: hypothetical protein ACLFPL_01895 [Candidatus Nanoarchaeia archaeon]